MEILLNPLPIGWGARKTHVLTDSLCSRCRVNYSRPLNNWGARKYESFNDATACIHTRGYLFWLETHINFCLVIINKQVAAANAVNEIAWNELLWRVFLRRWEQQHQVLMCVRTQFCVFCVFERRDGPPRAVLFSPRILRVGFVMVTWFWWVTRNGNTFVCASFLHFQWFKNKQDTSRLRICSTGYCRSICGNNNSGHVSPSKMTNMRIVLDLFEGSL